MRIDSHAHGDISRFGGDGAVYVDSCRERGVDGIVLIEERDVCVEAVKKFGDFIIPVARVDMDVAEAPEVEECISSGCRGVKFIRPASGYADQRYWLLYEKLEELGAVAVYHTGYVGFGRIRPCTWRTCGRRRSRPSRAGSPTSRS